MNIVRLLGPVMENLSTDFITADDLYKTYETKTATPLNPKTWKDLCRNYNIYSFTELKQIHSKDTIAFLFKFPFVQCLRDSAQKHSEVTIPEINTRITTLCRIISPDLITPTSFERLHNMLYHQSLSKIIQWKADCTVEKYLETHYKASLENPIIDLTITTKVPKASKAPIIPKTSAIPGMNVQTPFFLSFLLIFLKKYPQNIFDFEYCRFFPTILTLSTTYSLCTNYSSSIRKPLERI